MLPAHGTGDAVAEKGYDYFLVGKWEAGELLPALADGFRVRPDEVDIAYDEDGVAAEDRNWAAPVQCEAYPVHGDCSWILQLYAHGLAEVPDSRTLGLRLARWAGRVVLYSAPLIRPSAYWMATPDGRVGRARMYDPEDDWPDGTWRLETMELTVPQLPCVTVDVVYEMIGDEIEDHRPVHALRALVAALRGCCPEGGLELRGSLATGTHDRFSDFDLRWTVPGERFAEAVAGAGAYLGRSLPLLAARSDPEFHDTPDRRLLTYFFRGLPLFWRLDLEVRAATPPAGPVPAGGEWPLPVSALANAVGAVKAVARGRSEEEIRGLLDRGFARAGSRERATGRWAADVVRLADAAERAAGDGDPAAGELAARVRELVRDELVEGVPGQGLAGGSGPGPGPSHWMPCRHPAARAPSAPERSP
ncbi:hypothetical protein T261_3159 [Streptomyces lydicus]|nr:hypothetical protein T261_3159 [Streptomyces lydicus]